MHLNTFLQDFFFRVKSKINVNGILIYKILHVNYLFCWYWSHYDPLIYAVSYLALRMAVNDKQKMLKDEGLSLYKKYGDVVWIHGVNIENKTKCFNV